jgi:hypothetical protein
MFQDFISLKDLISVLQIDLVLPVSRSDQSILTRYYSHPRDEMLTDVVRLFGDAGIKLKRPRPSQLSASAPVGGDRSSSSRFNGDSTRLTTSYQDPSRPSRETAPFRSDGRAAFFDGEDDSDLDIDIERRQRDLQRQTNGTRRGDPGRPADADRGSRADQGPSSSSSSSALRDALGGSPYSKEERLREEDLLARTAKNVSIAASFSFNASLVPMAAACSLRFVFPSVSQVDSLKDLRELIAEAVHTPAAPAPAAAVVPPSK